MRRELKFFSVIIFQSFSIFHIRCQYEPRGKECNCVLIVKFFGQIDLRFFDTSSHCASTVLTVFQILEIIPFCLLYELGD